MDETDIIWKLPLFLAAVTMLAAAQLWWRVSNGKTIGGQHIAAGPATLRQAAFATCLCLGLLAVAILGLFLTRF